MAEKLTDKEKERIELEEKQARERAEIEARQKNERMETIRKQEEHRVDEIYNIALKRGIPEDVRNKAIEEKWPLDQFRAYALDMIDSGQKIRAPHSFSSNSDKTIGQLFVESPRYRDEGDKIGQRRTISIEVPRATFMQRATFSATDYSLTSIQKQPGVPGFLDQQEINVSQLFAQGTTSNLTVRFIQESSFTNAAAVAAEEGSYAAASLPVTETDATVYKTAVYLKTTDEMLADHEGMRSFIDGRLAYMVGAKEDYYLLNGSGSSQIYGILNVSGINTVDRGSYDTVADTIGQALNKVRSVGFITPDAVILHPNDWTDLILTKDENKQYLAGGPFTGAYGNSGFSNVGQIFGLPVITTTAITEGTGLVGAFRMGAQLFRKAGITIEASNAEASYFINGSVAVRAQSRMTLATYKPKAFCSITSIA